MSHRRYSAQDKIAVVQRVVADGRRVMDVAREAGVSQGSLFFWVRRYRELVQGQRGGSDGVRQRGPAAITANEVGTLVAYLRRVRAD